MPAIGVPEQRERSLSQEAAQPAHAGKEKCADEPVRFTSR